MSFFPFSFFFLFSLSSKPVSCNITITSTSCHPHTGDILSVPPQHCNYCTNPVATTTTAMSPFVGTPTTCCTHPHTCCGHTSHPTTIALTVPSEPKKASDKLFPLFFPFIFNGAGHLPLLNTGLLHPPWHTSTHPTSPCVHAGHPFAVAISTAATTSMPLQPAPPHQPHRPTTGITQLCHTDRGCKRCKG